MFVYETVYTCHVMCCAVMLWQWCFNWLLEYSLCLNAVSQDYHHPNQKKTNTPLFPPKYRDKHFVLL